MAGADLIISDRAGGNAACDNWGSPMKPRFFGAMVCYGVLALAAALTLERMPRALVWLFLGALAVKTWVAIKRQP
jgi:hypothetical protein